MISKVGLHTPLLPPIQSLNVKKSFCELMWGLINILKPCLKDIDVYISTFSTMHRFNVMRQDDIQSVVATPISYFQFSLLEHEENLWRTNVVVI